jgi:predicted GIY-YIG superfamily endonuclease
MVYHEIYDNKTDALIKEKQLKRWKSRERLESWIGGGLSSVGSEHPD